MVKTYEIDPVTGEVKLVTKIAFSGNRYVIIIPRELIKSGILDTSSLYRVTIREVKVD